MRCTIFEDTYIGQPVRHVQSEVVQSPVQLENVLDGGQVNQPPTGPHVPQFQSFNDVEQSCFDGQRVSHEQHAPQLRRSTRPSHPPDRFQPGLDYLMVIDCGEPSCYKEAMQRA